jgi:hypothetical protein
MIKRGDVMLRHSKHVGKGSALCLAHGLATALMVRVPHHDTIRTLKRKVNPKWKISIPK